MENRSDTAEGFLDVEQKAVLGISEKFEGHALAPYSEGVRLLWMETWQGTTAYFSSLGLVWIMRRLREEYDKAGKETKDEDTRWLYASAAVIEESENRALTKAKVAAWGAQLGKDKTRAALILVNRLLEDASDTDAKDDASEAQEGGEPGNGPASPLVSPSTSSVDGQDGGATSLRGEQA